MSTFSTVVAKPQAVYPTFKNILFATDFSRCSASALECLRIIAERHDSTVHVVHVVAPEQSEIAPVPGHSERQTITKKMNALLGAHPLANIPVEAWLARGPIAETLLGLARCEHIDLIALGTQGHGHKVPALGSVTGQVLLEAPCPVLTVGERICAEPERLGQILYATDFSPASLRALPYALSLAKARDSHLMLLYVDTSEVTADWLVEAAFEGRLLNLLPAGAAHLCSVKPIVGIGPVANGIVKAAAENHADVIVMGVSRGVPDFRTELYVRAHCPVLSVG